MPEPSWILGKDYLKKEKSAQIFQDAFRHSIAHGFLPGATNKIAFHVSYHYNLLIEPLFLNEDYRNYVLNVKCLTVTTKAVVDKLVDMASHKDTTEKLEQILVSYDQVVTDTEDKLRHLDT